MISSFVKTFVPTLFYQPQDLRPSVVYELELATIS
jgi:hypothetical protein